MSTIRNTSAVIRETTVLADVEMILIILDVVDELNVLHRARDFVKYNLDGLAKHLLELTRLLQLRSSLLNKKKLVHWRFLFVLSNVSRSNQHSDDVIRYANYHFVFDLSTDT